MQKLFFFAKVVLKYLSTRRLKIPAFVLSSSVLGVYLRQSQQTGCGAAVVSRATDVELVELDLHFCSKKSLLDAFSSDTLMRSR